MNKTFTLKKTISLHATTDKVWQALTDPTLIKKYFFGVDTITDWKVGSSIVYRGSWEGQQFEDKGKILKIEAQKTLVCNYWSAFSGLPDQEENYQKISYDLAAKNGDTQLTITQDNIASQEKHDHSATNWDLVLNGLKELVEK